MEHDGRAVHGGRHRIVRTLYHHIPREQPDLRAHLDVLFAEVPSLAFVSKAQVCCEDESSPTIGHRRHSHHLCLFLDKARARHHYLRTHLPIDRLFKHQPRRARSRRRREPSPRARDRLTM
eukprot:4471925-Pleurochrysis_carterae.AAC.4